MRAAAEVTRWERCLWAPSRPWFLHMSSTGFTCVLTQGTDGVGVELPGEFPPRALLKSRSACSYMESIPLLTPLNKEPRRRHFLQEALPDQSALGGELRISSLLPIIFEVIQQWAAPS